MANTKKRLFSVSALFIIYILIASLGVMGFLMLFPSNPAPLEYFSRSWHLMEMVLGYIRLFPALAMSALVIPFGLKSDQKDRGVSRTAFIERLQGPLFCALGGVVIYGLLFFLAFPLARNYQEDMRYQALLYNESMEKTQEAAAQALWPQAARFAAVCEAIWPESPAMADIRKKVLAELDAYYKTQRSGASAARNGEADLRRRTPVNAQEALEFAGEAYREERYYDAHWLATLAGRLAKPGSATAVRAARAASEAWNMVASTAPNQREEAAYRLYDLKQSGYTAMVAEDWIRAYYIFKELAALTPDDPDAVHFLAESEQSLGAVAFFADEVGTVLGDVQREAVFSLPLIEGTPGAGEGRLVMRLGVLYAFSDVSYGADLEILAFDDVGERIYRLTAPYVKILPKKLDGEQRTVFLLRALDRQDERLRWEPVWEGRRDAEFPDSQLTLDLSYTNFLLASQVRQGPDSFLLGDLLAARRLGDWGYAPEVFQVELLTRFAEPVLFLPLLVLTLALGRRFRSQKPPRYLGIPMLFLLPLVFNGMIHVYRSALYGLGIWAVLAAGFSLALPLFIAGAALLFILALITLIKE